MKRKIRLRVRSRKTAKMRVPIAAIKAAWGFILAVFLFVALSFALAVGQSGVLIPSPGEKPDPNNPYNWTLEPDEENDGVIDGWQFEPAPRSIWKW